MRDLPPSPAAVRASVSIRSPERKFTASPTFLRTRHRISCWLSSLALPARRGTPHPSRSLFQHNARSTHPPSGTASILSSSLLKPRAGFRLPTFRRSFDTPLRLAVPHAWLSRAGRKDAHHSSWTQPPAHTACLPACLRCCTPNKSGRRVPCSSIASRLPGADRRVGCATLSLAHTHTRTKP